MSSQASYDLHLHTCWSYDASAAPACYLQKAKACGVRVLAITDHHVVDGLAEAQKEADEFPGIRIIRGAELTVATTLGSSDLICLGFPERLPQPLIDIFEAYHQWQRDYGAAIVRGLNTLHCRWDEADRRRLLESYRPSRVIDVQGLTHVKNEVQQDEFKRRRFIESDGMYWELISAAAKAGSAPSYPTAEQVVPVLKAHGVLVVIAHPSGYFEGQNRQRMDRLRDECRLDGIECAHPRVSPELTRVYRQYCLEHGLLSTAGTDCHTEQDVADRLGRHGGSEAWLDEVVERLPG